MNPGQKSRYLTVELTEKCNNNCCYCYQRRGKQAAEKTDRVAERIVEFAGKGFRQIEFSGGEPTLSPHLFYLMSLAKGSGYRNIFLSTNGRRLAYFEYCRELIARGLNSVIFSIPAHNARLYKKITGVGNEAFSQVEKALDNVFSAPINGIEKGAVVLINRYNYKELPEIVEWLGMRPFSFLTLVFPIPYGGTMDRKSTCSYTAIAPYLKKAIISYKGKAKLCIEGIPFCFFPGHEDLILNEIAGGSCVIDCEGEVRDRLEEIGIVAAKMERCKKCLYKNKCPGLFIDFAKEYGIIFKKEDFGAQKVALDIQSGRCDYDCVFCARQMGAVRFYRLDNKAHKAPLYIDKLKLFFRTSARICDHLDIWGRERADEYDEIGRVLKLARSSGFKRITLWSSGLRLDSGLRVRKFINQGVTKFEFPVYGYGEKHDKITRVAGSFRRLFSSLQKLKETGKADIGLHFVLLKNNYADLPKLMELTSAFGRLGAQARLSMSAWLYYPDLTGNENKAVELYHKYCPSYSDIIGSLFTRKDLAGIKVELAFFPLCVFLKISKVFPNFKLIDAGFVRLLVNDRDGAKYRLLYGRGEFGAVYPKKCEKCAAKEDCPGIFREYLNIYGDKEFSPLRYNRRKAIINKKS